MKLKKLIAAILIVCLGCARGPHSPGEKAQVRDSPGSGASDRELEMGRQIHQAIVSTFQVYTEPQLVGYVNEIGRTLAAVADRKSLPYQFTVLYDDRAYATEAPGGFVYLTTGFLNFLQNEAELAALLAYEVAGLQFQDPRFSVSRTAMNAIAQTGAVVGPFFGQIGALAATALVLLNALTEPKTASPEEQVIRNDRKALRYLAEAGHDPQGYLDLIGRLLNLGQDWSPYFYDYLATRPVSLERYQTLIAEFEKLPLEERNFNVNRERYLAMTKGVREIYR